MQNVEKPLKMEAESIPPWKSNDMKVTKLLVVWFHFIKYTKILNFFLFFFQSFIWMQQAMHPELNYSSYFRKKWVSLSLHGRRIDVNRSHQKENGY